MTTEELDKTFTFGTLTDPQRAACEQLFDKARELATLVNDRLPECREKSLALTAIQTALLWADAAIGIRGLAGEVPK